MRDSDIEPTKEGLDMEEPEKRVAKLVFREETLWVTETPIEPGGAREASAGRARSEATSEMLLGMALESLTARSEAKAAKSCS